MFRCISNYKHVKLILLFALVSNHNYAVSNDVPNIEKKLQEMESSIQLMQKSLAATKAELEKTKQRSQFFSSIAHAEAGNHGFGIVSNDKKNKLFFHGVFQADQDVFYKTRGLTINNGTSSTPIINQNTVDRFWIRRARPIMYATFLEKNDLFFAPDFGQGQTRIFDTIIDLHHFKLLNLRAGKQISLIGGLDNLKNPGTLFTMEHGYPAVLAPNREIGFVFYGSVGPNRAIDNGKEYNYIRFNDWLSYEVGMLSGTFDNTNPGLNPTSPTGFSSETASVANKAFEARVFANPFLGSQFKYIQNLGIGLAGSTEAVNNQNTLPAITSIGQNPIFTYQPYVNGNGPRNRLHPQAFWFLGPLGILGEWTQTIQRLTNGPVPLSPLSLPITQKNTANQVELIYNITQEPLNFDALTPNRNFTPFDKGNYGAFQLVVRFTELQMDGDIYNDSFTSNGQTTYVFSDPRLSVQKANTWTVGLNWFWNRNIRISTEYNQTRFVGGCSTGGLNSPVTPGCLTAGSYATASTSTVVNRPNENLFMQRMQLFF